MYQARPLDGLARTPTPCVVPPTLSSPPTFSPPLPPHLPSLSPVQPSAGYGGVSFYNGGASTSPADAHQRAAAALSAVSAAQHISFEAVEDRLRAEQKVQRALLCGVEQQRRRALVLLGAVARLQADEADARIGLAWSEARLRRSLWVRSLARPPRRSRSAAGGGGDPSGRRRSRSAVSASSTDGGLARYGARTHAVTPLHEGVGGAALPPSYDYEAEAASPPLPLPAAPSAEVCAQELMLASREERVARAALVQAERLGFDFVVSRSKGERRKFRSEKKAYESYSRRIGHFHAEPEGSEVRPTIHDGLRVDTSAVSSRLHRTAIGHNKRNVTAAAEEPPRRKFAGTTAAAAATQQAKRAAEEEAGSEHRRRAARVLESMTVDAEVEAAEAAAAAVAESLPLRSESAAPLPLWPPPTPSASIVAAVDAALLGPAAGLPPQASSALLAAQPSSKHISPPRGPGADGAYRATRVSFADDASSAPAARSASQPAPSTASRGLLRRVVPPPSAAVPVHAAPSACHRSGSVLSSLLESTAGTRFISRYAGPPVSVPARSLSAAEPLLSLPLPLPCRSATSEPVDAAAAAAAAASAIASAAADAAAAASAAADEAARQDVAAAAAATAEATSELTTMNRQLQSEMHSHRLRFEADRVELQSALAELKEKEVCSLATPHYHCLPHFSKQGRAAIEQAELLQRPWLPPVAPAPSHPRAPASASPSVDLVAEFAEECAGRRPSDEPGLPGAEEVLREREAEEAEVLTRKPDSGTLPWPLICLALLGVLLSLFANTIAAHTIG